MKKPLPTDDPAKAKVGIVWAGSPSHPNDAERSVRLSRFKVLEELNVQLYSFQKDLRQRVYTTSQQVVDLAASTESMKIIHVGDKLDNFETTAAYLNDLDLLITVDTATLHLAGALWIPTIALIPYNPDWRWGLEGDRTEWYPSVRLLRQDKKGDWDNVFAKLPHLAREVLLEEEHVKKWGPF